MQGLITFLVLSLSGVFHSFAAPPERKKPQRTMFPTPVFSVERHVTGAAAGDFNGDGVPDIIAMAKGVSGFTLFPGNGNGSFSGEISVMTQWELKEFAIGDFDTDGNLDVVFLNQNDTVSLFLGPYQGEFSREIVTGLEGYAYSSLTAGNYDRDGRPDLLLSSRKPEDDFKKKTLHRFKDVKQAQRVTVLHGFGDGTFAREREISGLQDIARIVAGDFNGDGSEDMAALNLAGTELSISLNRGEGKIEPQHQVTLNHGTHEGRDFHWLHVSDVNGDRLDDLIVICGAVTEVAMIPGSKKKFRPTLEWIRAENTHYNRWVVDIDANGELDLLLGLPPGGPIHILPGRGEDRFLSGPNSSLYVSSNRMLWEDFNKDGREDLAVVSGLPSGSIRVFLGNEDGTHGARFLPSDSEFIWWMAPRPFDFDGDGDLDLVVSSGKKGRRILLYPGHGDGSFGPERVLQLEPMPTAINAGDFDSDGRIDLAISFSLIEGKTAGSRPRPRRWGRPGQGPGTPPACSEDDKFPHGAVSIFLGDGRSEFTPAGQFEVGVRPKSILVTDWDADGAEDLLIWNRGQSQCGIPGDLLLLPGSGDGTFQRPTSLGTGEPTAFALGDFNSDRLPDLVVSRQAEHPESGSVEVLFNTGDGSLSEPVILTPGGTATCVKVGDFDGDGRADIAATVDLPPNMPRGRPVLYLNRGEEAFSIGKVLPGTGVHCVDSGNFNADDNQDLVFIRYSGEIWIFLGEGNGSFEPPLKFSVGSQPDRLAVADLNGDGRDDLVAMVSRNISILINNSVPKK